MNIVYLLSTLERTGPTNVVFDIISGLDRTRFFPFVITLSPEPARSRLADFENLNVPVHCLELSRLSSLFGAVRRVQEQLFALRADVCHSHGLRADLVSALIHARHSKCSTVHAVLRDDYKLAYGRWAGQILQRLHSVALKSIGNPIACSSAVKEYLTEDLRISTVKCVRNGVSTGRFRPDSGARHSVRKTMGIAETSRVWISTGALIQRKRPEQLVEGWINVYGNVTNEHLIVLGTGPLNNNCVAKAAGVSNVSFLGNVPDVTSYLQASDLFLSCSSAEGLPLAVLEAMGCGLHCVLSDIPPHLEITEFSPQGILTFELDSCTSFANALIEAGGWFDRNEAVNIRNIIISQFCSSFMASQYQEIYHTIRN